MSIYARSLFVSALVAMAFFRMPRVLAATAWAQ